MELVMRAKVFKTPTKDVAGFGAKRARRIRFPRHGDPELQQAERPRERAASAGPDAAHQRQQPHSGALCGERSAGVGEFVSSSGVNISSLTHLRPQVTTPEEYPVWRTLHPLVVPRGVALTYKYCIFEGGSFKRWEKLSAPGAPGAAPVSARTIFVDEPLKEVQDSLNRLGDVILPPSPSNLQQQLARAVEEEAVVDPSQLSKQVGIPDHLTLVCFHLPIELDKDASGKWTARWAESLISKTQDTISDQINTRWMGTVSYQGHDGGELPLADQEEIRELLRPMNCCPVFIGQHLRRQHYKGFCKQVIWPAFHNVDSLDSNSAVWRRPPVGAEETSAALAGPAQEPALPDIATVSSRTPSPRPRLDSEDLGESFYDSYLRVNEIFVENLVKVLKETQGEGLEEDQYAEGIVWVHDYHLMLLPKMLHDVEISMFKERRSRVVFFLHIPFPTSQIFRTLSCGEALLQGMVSADVVGFHAFDHARHFLNACKRILGLNYKSRKGGLMGVEYQGRVVMVVMSHVGIEPTTLDAALEDAKCIQTREELLRAHPDRILISGYDPCERLQGVALKLLAFEKLMDDYPIWSDKVVLVQRCIRNGSRPGDEEHTSHEIRELVDRINGKHRDVVDYAEVTTKMFVAERMGMYQASDIFLALAVREGLNLCPLEYIYARQDPLTAGVVVASEFSACTSMLSGILRVNPFHLEHTVQVLDKALAMTDREKFARRARDLPFIKSRPSALWTRQVLEDMAAVLREEQEKDEVTDMEPESMTSGVHNTGGAGSGYAPLNFANVISSYTATRSRVILLDYGGTLLKKEELGKYLKRDMTACKSRTPSQTIFSALDVLSRDSRNLIMIVSSLQREMLEKIFAAYPEIGLGASNGHSFSWPERLKVSSSDEFSEFKIAYGEQRQWEVFDYGVDWDAVQAVALPIMERYTWHTNGSNLSLRSAGIEWSYYSTDPEWGTFQAKKMAVELEIALSSYDVKVHHNRGMIEVVPRRLNKGLVASLALSKAKGMKLFDGDVSGRSPEFVLVVGDDASDEHMFRSLYNFMGTAEEPDAELDGQEPMSNVYTVSVGMRPSNATRYVNSVDDMEVLLEALAREAAAN
eukprot:scaffold2171_cov253-Pinguiococcus_pyrenoidosus.AAC.7